MVNSVHPEQTAAMSSLDLDLHCLHMPFVRNFGVQNFRTFTVILLYHKYQYANKIYMCYEPCMILFYSHNYTFPYINKIC